jgi:radical SAM protein with 4Fe4S-binding SPASM domain
MTETQRSPFCMQVELTEGCNLRCPFCGLNGIRTKQPDLKFMSVTTADHIVSLLKQDHWTPRIEFAMHGEPSLNPSMIEILHLFRRKLPSRTHLMMTSNGGGFLKETTGTVDAALESLNVLALDCYENVQIVPKVLERYKGQHVPVFYPADKSGNPHRRRKPSEHDFVIVQDISEATRGTHASLNNHAGCGSPKNDKAAGKRCAKPFREISVRWDGSVAICCNDWRGLYKCGNVLEQGLEEIWQGSAFAAARRKLYHGMRDFGPCKGCDALSYRPGLLPDLQGKGSLPRPPEGDLGAIREALAGPPLTAPVLRPWELAGAKKKPRGKALC